MMTGIFFRSLFLLGVIISNVMEANLEDREYKLVGFRLKPVKEADAVQLPPDISLTLISKNTKSPSFQLTSLKPVWGQIHRFPQEVSVKVRGEVEGFQATDLFCNNKRYQFMNGTVLSGDSPKVALLKNILLEVRGQDLKNKEGIIECTIDADGKSSFSVTSAE